MPRPPLSLGSTRRRSPARRASWRRRQKASGRASIVSSLAGHSPKAWGVTPGSELAVVGQGKDGSIANDLYTVAGVIPSAIDLVNRQGVLMSLADAQQLFVMPDEASEIILHATRPERRASWPGVRRCRSGGAPWQDVVPELVAILELADVSSYIVLIFVFVAAAAG